MRHVLILALWLGVVLNPIHSQRMIQNSVSPFYFAIGGKVDEKYQSKQILKETYKALGLSFNSGSTTGWKTFQLDSLHFEENFILKKGMHVTCISHVSPKYLGRIDDFNFSQGMIDNLFFLETTTVEFPLSHAGTHYLIITNDSLSNVGNLDIAQPLSRVDSSLVINQLIDYLVFNPKTVELMLERIQPTEKIDLNDSRDSIRKVIEQRLIVDKIDPLPAGTTFRFAIRFVFESIRYPDQTTGSAGALLLGENLEKSEFIRGGGYTIFSVSNTYYLISAYNCVFSLFEMNGVELKKVWSGYFVCT